MNHVTFETSKRLEAAGFPQPERRRFEFWYTTDGHITPLAFDLKDGVAPIWRYFAPTATDILKELGKSFMLNSIEEEGKTVFVTSEWAEARITTIRIVRDYIHENPAEAAAMAWLQIHEKK